MGGNEDFHIRRATEADGDAIQKITENNPDTGDLSFAPQFEANPYRIHSARNPDAVGFIAETPDGEPAGTGFAYFITARVGGDIRETAFLSNLAVSADYRNQGLAKRLARERIDHAEEKHGDDCVIGRVKFGVSCGRRRRRRATIELSTGRHG